MLLLASFFVMYVSWLDESSSHDTCGKVQHLALHHNGGGPGVEPLALCRAQHRFGLAKRSLGELKVIRDGGACP